jgi:arylsulfatase A-like enzyme
MKVPDRTKNVKSERLLVRIISSHYLSRKAAQFLYRKYDNLRKIREFHSRMKQVNPDEYLDTSYRPDLNVIILVVDCLRNSHLSCQGYSRQTTPFLDSIKSRFSAISASYWTYPSVVSILTGLYPHNHNAIITGEIKNFSRLENFRKLRDDVLTLPEMLFLLGYRIYFGTAIHQAFYPLEGRVISRRCEPLARADNLLNNLTKWISKKRERFFAYVHLGDLHEPLDPPGGFRHFFGNVEGLPNIDRWDFRTPEEQKSGGEMFREYRENRELLYANTLRYVDHAMERFYQSLRDMGLVDSTILVITGDHGEEFWEHAELEAENFYDPRGYYGVGHAHSVFNELIEVPLFISGPVPGRESIHSVSTVDIVPTIIDLLGVKHNMRFDGQNVFETDEERPLLSEASGFGYEKKALVMGRYKLVYSKGDGIEWVFNLEKDPEEQHPITDRKVTSIFAEKLSQILTKDEKLRVKEVIKKKGLSRSANVLE